MARKPRTPAEKQTPQSVSVKNAAELIATFNTFIEFIFHRRIGKSYPKNIHTALVAYGPWIMAMLHLLVLPALLVFAKEGQFVSISTFISTVFFNQSSWILMLVVLANCLLLADGLSNVFAKQRRGWDRLYIALLINGGYILSQLLQNPLQFAAPLISLMVVALLLFSALEVKKYYK